MRDLNALATFNCARSSITSNASTLHDWAIQGVIHAGPPGWYRHSSRVWETVQWRPFGVNQTRANGRLNFSSPPTCAADGDTWKGRIGLNRAVHCAPRWRPLATEGSRSSRALCTACCEDVHVLGQEDRI